MNIEKINRRFTITLDNKEIPLAFTLYTVPMHKKYFKRDFFSTLLRITQNLGEITSIPNGTRLAEIVWTLAKAENNKIEPFHKWLNNVNAFPTKEILPLVIKGLKKGGEMNG